MKTLLVPLDCQRHDRSFAGPYGGPRLEPSRPASYSSTSSSLWRPMCRWARRWMVIAGRTASAGGNAGFIRGRGAPSLPVPTAFRHRSHRRVRVAVVGLAVDDIIDQAVKCGASYIVLGSARAWRALPPFHRQRGQWRAQARDLPRWIVVPYRKKRTAALKHGDRPGLLDPCGLGKCVGPEDFQGIPRARCAARRGAGPGRRLSGCR